MWNEDAMPVTCDCGTFYDFGDSRQGFQCEDCEQCFCGECLPGHREPRKCGGCTEALQASVHGDEP